MFQAVGCWWKVGVCAVVLAAVAVTAEPGNTQERTQELASEKPQLAAQKNAPEVVHEKPDLATVFVPAQTPDAVQKRLSARKPDFARYLARPDGSMPMIHDWSTRHVIYTAGYRDEQAERMARDPRALAAFVDHGIIRRRHDPITPRPASGLHSVPSSRTLKRDWAVPLPGGVGSGVFPAKYSFDVNAPPSCTKDFVVFPTPGITGASRASVLGTFTDDPTIGQTVSITITPAGSSPVTLTLTAGTANTGTTFAVSGTSNTSTDAANLAAAVDRNLSNIPLDELAAVSFSSELTVYALTGGSGVTLAVSNDLTNFSWGSVTAGVNGSKANIVGFNNLYAGSVSPFCAGYSYPTFTFSYIAGVGETGISPVLSLDGQRIAFVENDNSEESFPLGAILHVLTLGTGTEYGSCTNNGTAAPTCATAAVIPGSTPGSNASDYMLPLGAIAALGTTYYPALDSGSPPFVDYSADALYVGDDRGDLFSVSPVFDGGTPALRSGFPIVLSSLDPLSGPIVDVGNTDDIFVEDAPGQRVYRVTSSGVSDGYTSIGFGSEYGQNDAVIVDSTNAVGFAASPCNEESGTYPEIVQFSTLGTGGPVVQSTATLSGGCVTAIFSPTPDNNYFTEGISSDIPGNNGELLVAYGNSSVTGNLAQLQFTSGILNTTAEYTDNDSGSFGAGSVFTPLTEFYGDDQAYAIGTVTQNGNTATVTTTMNLFVTNQVVVMSGIAAGTGGCTSSAANAINGEQTITVNSPTSFTFTSPVNATIGGANGNCNLTGSLATGPTKDYLFFGLFKTTLEEALAFDLPLTSATQTQAATNTTSVGVYTSAMTIDNDSSDGQASSIYFTTEDSSSGCAIGATCAVKLTQAGLN